MDIGGGAREVRKIVSKFSDVGAQFGVHFQPHNKRLSNTSSGSTLADPKSILIDFCGKKQRSLRSSVPYFTYPCEGLKTLR